MAKGNPESSSSSCCPKTSVGAGELGSSPSRVRGRAGLALGWGRTHRWQNAQRVMNPAPGLSEEAAMGWRCCRLPGHAAWLLVASMKRVKQQHCPGACDTGCRTGLGGWRCAQCARVLLLCPLLTVLGCSHLHSPGGAQSQQRGLILVFPSVAFFVCLFSIRVYSCLSLTSPCVTCGQSPSGWLLRDQCRAICTIVIHTIAHTK